MPAGWYVRRASPADFKAILSIEQVCDDAPHWSKASWLDALSKDQRTEPARASFVAENSNEIIGFAVISCVGNLAELESIAVSIPARRQGIGRELCRQGMDWSRDQGARTIELEVRASSRGALALYQSLGFIEQGRRRNYYRKPIEEAVLMAATLAS
jgi:ribosomal-protein-alanine N-acetyltransferase